MPEPVKISDMPIEEHPMEYALKKFQKTDEFSRLLGESVETSMNCAFLQGWKGALEWFPFRIQQFREMEEALKAELADANERAREAQKNVAELSEMVFRPDRAETETKGAKKK